jgi:WD40 repeat protein
VRRLGAGFISTMAVVSLLGSGSASGSAVDYWIVFGSFRDGDFTSSIHAVRPDGTSERELSLHRDGSPASLDPWSAADESVVLFTRGGGDHRSAVWTLDPQAMEEQRTTPEVMVRFRNGRAWPSVRPGHAGEFSYVREVGGERRVVLGRLDGSSELDLGPGEFPSWSPDGTRLAYVRGASVWLQTPGADDAQPLVGPLTGMSYPSWSPAGDALLVSGNEGGGVDLYEVRTDGVMLRRLTNSPDTEEVAAIWSPDGSRIAFAALSEESADGWQHSIFVFDLATGTTQEVTSGRFHDSRPTWSVGRAP